MELQFAAVLLIEVLAIAYLAYAMIGRKNKKKPSRKPDVAASDIVRKKRAR